MSIWEELKHRLEKGMEAAGQKSQQMVEISRLTLRIRGKKEDINRLYRRLGILVFEAWGEGDRIVPSPEMKEVVRNIREVQEQITAMERELLTVRGKVACPACGAVLERSAETCPACYTVIRRREMVVSPVKEFQRKAGEDPASDPLSRHRKVTLSVPDESIRTAGDEAIFICPECGCQLGELAESCSQCGHRFG